MAATVQQQAEPSTVSVSSEETNYAPFVFGAINAAALLFCAQAVTSMLVANWLGARTEIQFAKSIIPYAAIVADPSTFVSVVAWSTLSSVAMMCIAVVRSLMIDKGDPLRLYGWATGLFMAGMLVAWQYLRHLLTDTGVNHRVLGLAVLMLVAAILGFIALKPENPLFSDGLDRAPKPSQTNLSSPRLPAEFRVKPDPSGKETLS